MLLIRRLERGATRASTWSEEVIFTTDYAGDALDRSRAGLEEFRIIPKPFTPKALASLLREVLGGAAPR